MYIKNTISLFIWNLFVNILGKSVLTPKKLRYIFYKISGMRTSTSNIRAGCVFRGKSIIMGKGVFLNHNVFIDSWEKVTIKENTAIAFDVLICTSTHRIGDVFKRAGKLFMAH